MLAVACALCARLHVLLLTRVAVDRKHGGARKTRAICTPPPSQHCKTRAPTTAATPLPPIRLPPPPKKHPNPTQPKPTHLELVRERRAPDRRLQGVDGDLLLCEEQLRQGVVRLGDALDELGAARVGLGLEVVGHGALLDLRAGERVGGW